MTELVTSYVGLIVPEHADRPRYVATITTSCSGYVDSQNVVLGLPEKYDLDVAVGVQLDAVGLWVGVSRYVNVPLGDVYFSWDVDALGWDKGWWKGEFDPVTGVVRLDDETYRLLIRARIIANSWDGTLLGAQAALDTLFNGSTTPNAKLFMQDNMDMSMDFVLAGEWPTAVFVALFSQGLLGLKPAGVLVNYYKTSVDGAPAFAWDIESDSMAGWDEGAWVTEA